MSSYIVCLFVSLCCSLIIASTAGGAIHKNSKNAKRSTDHISCLAPVDGPRLGFQNEHGKNMKDQLVAAGERVELKCEVFGTPQATIHWKHNGILMEKSAPIGNYESRMENGDEPIIGLSTTVAVLVIDCVDDETAGHYSCVADNGCTEAIESSAIVAIEQNGEKHPACPVRSIFAGITPRINLWTDSLLERPEVAATLFCRAEGRPKPKIEWMVEDDNEIYQKVSNGDKHVLLPNGDLLIRGHGTAENSKAGVGYQCVASNDYGSASLKSIIIRAHA